MKKATLFIIGFNLICRLTLSAAAEIKPALICSDEGPEYAILKFTSPHLEKPLQIGFDGGIFLRTKNRTFHLQGSPQIHSQTKNHQEFRWPLEEDRRSGVPIIRPLALFWTDQKGCRQDWQTYLYGPDILVSAIWQKDINEHTLYLPAGIDWINAWDNQTFSGGRLATLQTPLHKIPIFIRKGADVKLPDLEELWKESLEIAAQKSDLDQLQKKEFGTQ